MKIIKEFQNFNPHPENKFPQLDGVESNNDELSRKEMEEPLEVVSGFEDEEVEEMTDEELEDMYAALEKDIEKRNEGFIKTFESFNEITILIPMKYRGVIMELGEEVDPNEIISMYNDIVASEGESIPLVSYSEYGTEGKFYNENDDEIPTDSILDELNYAIGLDNSED